MKAFQVGDRVIVRRFTADEQAELRKRAMSDRMRIWTVGRVRVLPVCDLSGCVLQVVAVHPRGYELEPADDRAFRILGGKNFCWAQDGDLVPDPGDQTESIVLRLDVHGSCEYLRDVLRQEVEARVREFRTGTLISVSNERHNGPVHVTVGNLRGISKVKIEE